MRPVGRAIGNAKRALMGTIEAWRHYKWRTALPHRLAGCPMRGRIAFSTLTIGQGNCRSLSIVHTATSQPLSVS